MDQVVGRSSRGEHVVERPITRKTWPPPSIITSESTQATLFDALDQSRWQLVDDGEPIQNVRLAAYSMWRVGHARHFLSTVGSIGSMPSPTGGYSAYSATTSMTGGKRLRRGAVRRVYRLIMAARPFVHRELSD
jgi:hypothetical protein